MNLCVVVLTSNLDEVDKVPKYIPKVCYQVGEKSMLEICLDNVIRLNPEKIILMVSKSHIMFINKVVKHLSYSKKISYCVYEEEKRRISSAEKCYQGRDVLVIPGNAPLLSTKSMHLILSEKKNVKINNAIFYIRKDDLNIMDTISEYQKDNLLTELETTQVETTGQYKEVLEIFDRKVKNRKKILKLNH